jgi:Tfp pilus assembly protein PilN
MDMGQRVTVACSVILVVTIVVIGWRYWSLRQAAVQVRQELGTATEEIGRLDTIIDQVTALDARREELSRTVTLVDELQRHKSRPVRMLDELSFAVPDGLWLSELHQEDDEVVVRGRALALPALSDFLANLEASGYFQPPVEMMDSQLEETEQGEVVRFELRATFTTPDP